MKLNGWDLISAENRDPQSHSFTLRGEVWKHRTELFSQIFGTTAESRLHN